MDLKDYIGFKDFEDVFVWRLKQKRCETIPLSSRLKKALKRLRQKSEKSKRTPGKLLLLEETASGCLRFSWFLCKGFQFAWSCELLVIWGSFGLSKSASKGICLNLYFLGCLSRFIFLGFIRREWLEFQRTLICFCFAAGLLVFFLYQLIY